MPNWCSTAYVVEGDAQEVKSLYELMNGLQERKEPSVENGFGTSWLGCLVDALGSDWNEVRCRGDWANLEMDGDTLRFTTETAWGPCNETFDLVCKKFPSLCYYYQTEEPGMVIYATNDVSGKYFTDKYIVDMCTPDEEYYCEYFGDEEAMYKWFEEIFERPVKSRKDVNEITANWNDDAYCCINEFEIVD
ncbi:hypothetical protein [Paraprevotella clara]|uniref:hypothetical protein n=1 Tax=Paraprevotella clara TaxID=454154 RepID=UPI003FEFC5BF